MKAARSRAMTGPSALAPAVSPVRAVLLALLVFVRLTSQQDTGQSWHKAQPIPTNLVYERAVSNSSLTPSAIENGRSEEAYNNEEKGKDFEENYDYSDETEIDEKDPTLVRNQETYAVEQISKEKIVNESFQSGETYPEYHYYDYDYKYDKNTENEEAPELVKTNEKDETEVADEEYEDEPLPSQENEQVSANNRNSSSNSILIGEAIVSVVTTKSVVNGTFSVPVTPLPQATEQLDSPQPSSGSPPESSPESLATTPLPAVTEDTEKVLASVQTVRSISGARFLPFPGIDPLQFGNPESTSQRTVTLSSSSERSTESIIDKLDRVQSELSSGFLAAGFGSSGNNIQVDSLNAGKQPQKLSTTLRTPVINKFIPKRYNDRRLSKNATAPLPTVSGVDRQSDGKLKDVSKQLNNTGGTKTESFKTPTAAGSSKVVDPGQTKVGNLTVTVQDISAFLPPGYKLEQQTTTEKSLLSEILHKSQVDISAFLPPGFKKETPDKNNTQPLILPAKQFTKNFTKSPPVVVSTTTEKTVNSSKKVTSIQDIFAKTEVDLSSLLPKDYKQRFKVPEIKGTKTKAEDKTNSNVTTTSTTVQPSTTKASGIKLVFPSRPGGRKSIVKSTTPASSKGDGPEHVTPRIQKGWPTRATTEFTGWPKPSTTPISIEKLLEAARTATVSSLSNTSITISTSTISSTSTTTTTTTTPRPTTPGICDDECKVAGTIRLVGNATWVPELLDRNTREWQDLANRIEKEMNFVFSKSSILKKWFKEVKIDSFSQGSILADYFIELIDVQKPVDTQQLKVIFHDSLYVYNVNRYNDTSLNSTMKLGPFTIDPKFTDFIVIPRASAPQNIEDDRLIPQWVIAVIVIGVGGLLFIIVFGVSVLANRQNGSKLKPPMSAMYEEEISKNTTHTSNTASSMQRSIDYPKSASNSMWDETTPTWTHDKIFESTSNKELMDSTIPFEEEKRYNLYDSWRSEWNGYYYNPSHASSRYARYDSTVNLSRHHPNYNTNF